MSETLSNILLVLLFVLVGGFFAGSELALVSLREAQARALARRGRRGETVARLHANQNDFLASVQIGVTLAGFLSSAFGAATLADDLAPVLVGWGVPEGASTTVALVVITLMISYVSLVLGELVPKRLALQRSEGISLLVAPVLARIATLSRPVVWLLSVSTNAVVRLLGGDPQAARETITEEELRDMVAGHETLGGEERRLIEEVFAAGERRLHEVMVPRTEVDFLDASLPAFKAAKLVAEMPHSRYPVVRGSHDDVVGFVHVRDLFNPDVAGRNTRVGEIAREVAQLPGTKQVLPAMSEMRRDGHHLAIVLDEYGGTDGIVTLEDLVEELIGDIRDEYDVDDEQTRTLRGGSVEVDGLLNLDDLAARTGLRLPEGPYETVAGFVMNELGRVPGPGDVVEALGHRLEVTELDGRRVDRIQITPLPEDAAEGAPAPGAGDAPGDGDAYGDEGAARGGATALPPGGGGA
ncbi:hemolysin family protein [Vallicoccus soli]|uniref:HlyC/CorC family transporter n=1 Tax=Vallicoccus soli TaxID=2339232 RepID=A0A3A3YY99_9ACTN|nr:hemolysin family protein [Vallicoccus soli]RJK95274.1 HlyC/CorC family transporter [Vallicoccus soli]